MVLQVPIDFLLLLLAAVSAYYLRFTDWAIGLRPVLFHLTLAQFFDTALWVALGWLIIFAFSGLYSTDPNKKLTHDLSRVFLACSTGLAAVSMYALFSQSLFDSRFLILISWVLAVLYVSFGRILMRGIKGLMYRAGLGLRRVVVIGEEKLAMEMITVLQKRKELGYKVVAHYSGFGDDAIRELSEKNLDELIFINPRASEEETLRALDFCDERHIVFKYSADLFAALSANNVIYPLAGVPIVEMKRTRLDGWSKVVKRFFDIVASLLLIILFSPVMLLTALIILLETGRPIIYKNERVREKGKKFFAYKFRSMYQKDSTGAQFGNGGKKAEEREKELIATQGTKSGPIYKIGNDPRVTKFGGFIRKFSIDELPQFFNVLKGEMSLVGPRPHQAREVAGYTKRHKRVFSIKPGITGLSQISGRSDLSYEEEEQLDVLYIEKWSLWLDFVIFIKTPFILFKKRKAL